MASLMESIHLWHDLFQVKFQIIKYKIYTNAPFLKDGGEYLYQKFH